MSTLHEFQSRFGEFLLGRDRVDDAFRVGFAPNADVYRNNVRHAHTGALAAIFPAVRALVGIDYFDGIAAAFTAQEPPSDAVLAEYGARFPAFLETRRELERIAFLPDVARLEWAMNDCFHAAEECALTPDAAVRVFADETLVRHVRVRPTVRLLRSAFPVHDIRAAARNDDAQVLSLLRPAPTHLLVHRPAKAVVVQALAAGDFALLDAFTRRDSLDAAIASAAKALPEITPAEAISRLLILGVFAMPHLPAEGSVR